MDRKLANKFLHTYNSSENTRIYFTDLKLKLIMMMRQESDLSHKGEKTDIKSVLMKSVFVLSAKLMETDLGVESIVNERIAEDMPVPIGSKSAVETIANNNLSMYRNKSALKMGGNINRIEEEKETRVS